MNYTIQFASEPLTLPDGTAVSFHDEIGAFNITQFWSMENFANLPFTQFLSSSDEQAAPEPRAVLPIVAILGGLVVRGRRSLRS